MGVVMCTAAAAMTHGAGVVFVIVVPFGKSGWDERVNAEFVEQVTVAVLIGVVGGQEFVAVEDAVRTGEEAPGLRFVAHAFASGGETHVRGGHEDAGDGDGADELDRIERGDVRHRRAGDAHQHVERHRFRRARQVGQRGQKRGAVFA